MSRDRRQRRRVRRSRRGRPGYEPVGNVRMPGVMGWFQRNPRLFYVGGIAVMVLSLGAVFFGTQAGSGGARNTPSDAASAEDGQTDQTPTPEASPTTGATPSDEIQRVYSAPPAMTIDTSHSFQAVIRTEKGEIRLELLPQEAPGFVNNFVFLARNRFYDGLTFHRVVPGFVAQAGDPTATGFGDAGYDLPDERNRLRFEAGVISMAKAGDRVSSSQFFITLEPAAHLNADFTVFGRVVEGMDVLRALTARQPGEPPGARILSIEIIEPES